MVDPATTRKKPKFEATYESARVALFTLVSYKVGELRGRHVPHIMPADAVAHVNANASLSTTFVLSSGASTCVRTGSHHCTVPASVTLLLARTPPSLNSHRLGRALLLFRSHSPVFSPRSSIMGKSVPWILRLLKPCSARFALVAPARTRPRYLLMIPRRHRRMPCAELSIIPRHQP